MSAERSSALFATMVIELSTTTVEGVPMWRAEGPTGGVVVSVTRPSAAAALFELGSVIDATHAAVLDFTVKCETCRDTGSIWMEENTRGRCPDCEHAKARAEVHAAFEAQRPSVADEEVAPERCSGAPSCDTPLVRIHRREMMPGVEIQCGGCGGWYA